MDVKKRLVLLVLAGEGHHPQAGLRKKPAGCNAKTQETRNRAHRVSHAVFGHQSEAKQPFNPLGVGRGYLRVADNRIEIVADSIQIDGGQGCSGNRQCLDVIDQP